MGLGKWWRDTQKARASYKASKQASKQIKKDVKAQKAVTSLLRAGAGSGRTKMEADMIWRGQQRAKHRYGK